ncbi:MAG: LPS-assembly protein LptD, partial [Sphingomonadales bacterium]|nr:LPS-assembly protein LptD [Sphingomonadales bacterium]
MKSSLALFTLSLAAVAPASAMAQSQSDAAVAPDRQDDEIEFSADNIDYDFENDFVTATGNVVLNRDGYSLRADQVVWNRKSGAVVAEGNIRSISPDGDVAYGDRIELTDSLRDGAVDNLLLVLEDGSRL